MSNPRIYGAASGSFTPRAQLLSKDDVSRALSRMSHEVLERHGDGDLVLIGLQRGGVPFGDEIARRLNSITGRTYPSGRLDVAFHRDDLEQHPLHGTSTTSLPVDLDNQVVLIVDDVLYTGRTIRAALNALAEWGRPRAIELAVMVDRGHRELPIRPDYVGKNVPTSRREKIKASLDGVWIGDEEIS